VVVDQLREEGHPVGLLDVTCFRPWPRDDVRRALAGASRVVVLEKAFAVGAGGIVGQNVRLALSGLTAPVHNVVAGLGGRPITKQSLHRLFADALEDRLEPSRLTFLDLDRERVERELERMREGGRTGPHAENILRDLGVVAARSH
jgi:pyruvate ferredoxin oxidoreductase alpha subunit